MSGYEHEIDFDTLEACACDDDERRMSPRTHTCRTCWGVVTDGDFPLIDDCFNYTNCVVPQGHQRCGWRRPDFGPNFAAICVWHVFDAHPDVWAELATFRPLGKTPKDPRPEGAMK